MSPDFIFRLVGMILFMLIGGYWGFWFGSRNAPDEIVTYTLAIGTVGALFGLVATPYFTTVPVRLIRRLLIRISAENLLAGLVGLVAGLLVAALLTFPLSQLPDPFGSVLPFVAVVLFGYFGVALFVMRQADMMNVLANLGRGPDVASNGNGGWGTSGRTILLDTSVIIDGRVADIAKTGFLPGTLLIPRFVLNELQYIADSPDALRRQRGRRGMEVLAELQKVATVNVRISDIDVEGVREVDDKLIILARQLRCPILTNDYNLNRVAELQGVTILNINELANAVKSVVLPGEALEIAIIQEGKEPSQGVGYMDDGTMVVVENGSRYIGQTRLVTVTKVLQTAAGRMIFARPEEQ
ncbi:MAG: TRAM domain-containing protein [Anaerolineales bacterium]|nr:TRAM domain-containing protein [Anaerolineales bacterium]MCX7756006.1 TRAM domain-containing protein [Anaerolineales bacterium]MDW8277014.1 TRAM domain-containing protein [Anaerolineales bacterium]